MASIFSKYIWPRIYPIIDRIDSRVERNRILTAQQLIHNIHARQTLPLRLSDMEFRVFSQWGEDGIIQYLLSKVPIENDVFIEFGIEDYRESNTRFLLVNDNWRGLVIDANPDYITQIKTRDFYYRHDLTAISSFITKDNINQLIKSNGILGDIGLLSVDIDGNDYWVWEAINVVSPRIVVCEYNSLFGSKESVTIPYGEKFQRTVANYSNLYFGASLKALCLLAQKKGYVFVGSNKAGSNAFFVRKDVAENIPSMECEEGYVKSKMRESRDKDGRNTFISGDDRVKLIANETVIDISTNEEKQIKDLQF
jgi:hypothetical protein